MQEKLHTVLEEVKAQLEQAATFADTEEIRIRVLGKKGQITEILRSMGKLPPEEKKALGMAANKVKAEIEQLIKDKKAEIKEKEREEIFKSEVIDVTEPGKEVTIGVKHPITQTIDEIVELFKIGVIGEYELNKFKVELDNSKILLTNAKIQKESNIKALKILTSNDIDDILYNGINYTKIGQYDINIPQGIGSEILLQRPDIQSSLKILEEKNYLVGVARSAFLPNLSLTGLLGYDSKDLDLLVKNGSGTWGVAGNFMMPIFHWGEIYNNVNIAKLSKDEAFLQYENTLRKAFAEIQLALFNRKSYYENEKNYKNLFLAQSKIYEISSLKYESGVINLADYLQDQRNYLNAKLSYTNSSYELANSIVDVIKAFGGGFNAKDNSKNNIKEMEENLKNNFYNN